MRARRAQLRTAASSARRGRYTTGTRAGDGVTPPLPRSCLTVAEPVRSRTPPDLCPALPGSASLHAFSAPETDGNSTFSTVWQARIVTPGGCLNTQSFYAGYRRPRLRRSPRFRPPAGRGRHRRSCCRSSPSRQRSPPARWFRPAGASGGRRRTSRPRPDPARPRSGARCQVCRRSAAAPASPGRRSRPGRAPGRRPRRVGARAARRGAGRPRRPRAPGPGRPGPGRRPGPPPQPGRARPTTRARGRGVRAPCRPAGRPVRVRRTPLPRPRAEGRPGTGRGDAAAVGSGSGGTARTAVRGHRRSRRNGSGGPGRPVRRSRRDSGPAAGPGKGPIRDLWTTDRPVDDELSR